MRADNNLPKPPRHLSAEAKAWWISVVQQYEFADTDLRLLQLAAEAWDRGQSARRVLGSKGLTYVDPKRGPRMRPEAVIQRDAEASFARLVRQLALDLPEPGASPSRRKAETYWPKSRRREHGLP